MGNSLVHKVQPDEIINDVNNNLQNYEIDYDYTTKLSQNVSLDTTLSLNLVSPSSLPTSVPFIELISDYAVDLTFADHNSSIITSLKGITFLSGNIKGYNFSITNNSTETANIQWRIYY